MLTQTMSDTTYPLGTQVPPGMRASGGIASYTIGVSGFVSIFLQALASSWSRYPD